MMSSSRPKQKPCGELNWPLLGPSCPNLHLICMGLTLLARGITVPTAGTGCDTIVLRVSGGIISSGVDSKGEVEEDTAPKPFIRLLVRLSVDGELERTSIPPFGKAVSAKTNEVFHILSNI